MGAKIRSINVLKKLGNCHFNNLLDAGCGKAYVSFILAQYHPTIQITGLDINTERIAYNEEIRKKLSLNNLEFLVEDLNNMKLEHKYDLILSVDNLEHIEDDLAVLSNFRSVIKENGLLIIQVPKVTKKFFYRSVPQIGKEDHFRDGYSAVELSDKLSYAGFQVLDVAHIYNFFESIANQTAMMLSKILPLYAFCLPFLILVSRIPDWFLPARYRFYNSLQIFAKPRSMESTDNQKVI